MSSIDDIRISFRPVTSDDYPLLDSWLNTPHMREWWGDPETELGYIRDMLEGRDTTRPFLFLLDNAPVGYIQYWYIADHLDEPWLSKAPWVTQVPTDSIGVDMAIGDAALLSKGLGSAVLKAFTARLRSEGYDNILIDPDTSNARAIRAYEKVGFRPLIVSRESSEDEDTAVLIMRLVSEDSQTNSEFTP
ncbi:GNAT family N-acetyltransferase [Hoeflea sp. AS60]|uniref:GNAT family N-acetyltransferase n=1 Tax=Hoeflea sp. AS60 TaxID=3135780 RepID=UPI00316FDA4E